MHALWLELGLLILAGAAVRIALVRRRQSRALHDLAVRRRLNFSAEDLIGVYERYHHLDLMVQGHRRHVWNVLYGTTDAGLVTLFSYSYDLGFGVNRTSRQWWVAVVESRRFADPWRACRAEEGSSADTTIGRWRIHTPRASVRPRLQEAQVDALFDATGPEGRWEVRGPLTAGAIPFDAQPRTAEQLLGAVCQLARQLRPADDLKLI